MTTELVPRVEVIPTWNRSRLYSMLAYGFRFPEPARYEAIQGGAVLGATRAAIVGLPYPLAAPADLGTNLELSHEAFAQEYTSLFDVGGGDGPPCCLYEAEFGGGRLKVLEEVLRYYHHFGLQLAQGPGERDRPDHLGTELTFLHALTFKEAELLDGGREVAAYRRAERDFLRFHLTDFVAEVAAMVVPRGIPFYSELAGLAKRFCQAEQTYLAGLQE